MLSANFEFDEEVSLEFHDGEDYDGGFRVRKVALWRDRVQLSTEDGSRFEASFELSRKVFADLRRHLKILKGEDCMQE